jgi:hypothetical protein
MSVEMGTPTPNLSVRFLLRVWNCQCKRPGKQPVACRDIGHKARLAGKNLRGCKQDVRTFLFYLVVRNGRQARRQADTATPGILEGQASRQFPNIHIQR